MSNISNKDLDRIKHTKRNSKTALVFSILMGVFSFIEKTTFNQFFIADYLGLSSFYNNVISILSATELGIYTSIAYALYGPLEHKDREQICTILKFLKKAYTLIGSIILGAGLLFLPFIRFLINVDIPLHQVYIFYVIYLFSSAINYFLNYRNVLYSASQDQYVITLASYLTWSILYIVQTLITIITQSFLIYTIAMLMANIIRDIILYVRSRYDFPDITIKNSTKINPAVKDRIIKNTKGLIATKIGSTLVNSTDSILISAMVSTVFLGYYSNYQMILGGMRTLIVILPEAVTASIGNIGVTEKSRKISSSFWKLDLGSFFIFSALSILFINTANPIVRTFFGANKLIPLSSLILLAMNFYLRSLREMLISYKSSLGLYWYDRKRPLLEGLANLIVSILLSYIWGFNGIILGTIITNTCINLVIEPRVIFHYGLKRSAFWYYCVQFGRFSLTVGISAISYMICHILTIPDFGNFSLRNFSFSISGGFQIVLNAIVSIVSTILIFFIFYRKNNEAKTIVETVKVSFSGKLGKNNEK